MGCVAGLPVVRPARRQQPARHPVRHGGGQADARRAPRRRPDAGAVRRSCSATRSSRSWSPPRPGDGRCCWRCWPIAARRRAGPGGARRRPRPGPDPRARRHRSPPARRRRARHDRPPARLLAIRGRIESSDVAARSTMQRHSEAARRSGRAAGHQVDDSQASRAAVNASGRSRWTVWPAPGITTSVRAGEQRRHPLGGARRTSGRRAPATISTGHADRRAAGPTAAPACPVPARRRLDASPATVLRRRSSRSGSASPANSGWATQRVEERLEPVALDRRRERVVGRPPGGALGGVVDAAGGADQHESLDEVGPRQRRGAGTAARPSSSRRTSPRPATSASRPAPPTQVGARPPPSRRGRARRRRRPRGRPARWSATAVPRARRLGEPVDEDDARPPARAGRAARASAGTGGARRRRTCTNTSGSWAPGIDQRRSITYVGTAVISCSAAKAQVGLDLDTALVGVEEAAHGVARPAPRRPLPRPAPRCSPTLRPRVK